MTETTSDCSMTQSVYIFLCLFISFNPCLVQETQNQWFDFWVGKWEVTWKEGKTGKGTNTDVKILDNTIIQENFKIDKGLLKGYMGTSISVLNPTTNTWHQGYADNQGAYFNFVGERQGYRKIFKTESVNKDGKVSIQRMVFYDISENAFTWDWELSTDGGFSWKLNWRIFYKRIDK